MIRVVSPAVGAIQGRKKSKSAAEDSTVGQPSTNTDWVRKRAFRGGTHATLIRTSAASGVNFPPDLEVWEDEYLRRHIESEGYLWIFNHQAIFSHKTQNRHGASWKSGYLQAKYGLRPFWHTALNIPYALVTGNLPIGQIAMLFGYLHRCIEQKFYSIKS